MNVNSTKRRLAKLQNLQEDPIPPINSYAFQLFYIVMPAMLKTASGMTEREKKRVLALDPLEWKEGYSRDTVIKAQKIIRESMSGSC